MPILTYGTEIVKWTEAGVSRLRAVELRFLRSIRVKPKGRE
jgi:hypothetical protein